MNIKNLALTGLVSLSVCATTVLAAEKKVLLKVPTTFSTNLIGLGTPLPAFKKRS